MGPPTSLLVGVACEFEDMDQPEPESEQKCSLRGGVAVPIREVFRAGHLQHKLYPRPTSG
jgi:hypothetical protein